MSVSEVILEDEEKAGFEKLAVIEELHPEKVFKWRYQEACNPLNPFFLIPSKITEQHNQILDLIIKIKEGNIFENISQTEQFQEIEKLHQEELTIIDIIEKEANSKKGKIIKVMKDVIFILNRHKKLLQAQGFFMVFPT